MLFFLVPILFHGAPRKNLQSLVLVLSLNTARLPLLLLSLTGLLSYFASFVSFFLTLFRSIVITSENLYDCQSCSSCSLETY
uniref:Uncharacterized protein n=1 Tax=Raphanus sativus TaxID=3726 RepID=A0A650GCA6_RAPSA|nr:hypothetical protein [Raphanus sativus]